MSEPNEPVVAPEQLCPLCGKRDLFHRCATAIKAHLLGGE